MSVRVSIVLAARLLAHLNAALLFSLQLLYLMHHPASRAIAALCLAARDVGIEAIDEWCEALGTNGEELGNLVAGLESCEG